MSRRIRYVSPLYTSTLNDICTVCTVYPASKLLNGTERNVYSTLHHFYSWLIRVGVGHLAGRRLLGVQDKKGFNQLLTALIDKTEQHHGGARLKQMVRQIVQKQNRSNLRLSSRPSNVATTAATTAVSKKKSSGAKSDVENAGFASTLTSETTLYSISNPLYSSQNRC